MLRPIMYFGRVLAGLPYAVVLLGFVSAIGDSVPTLAEASLYSVGLQSLTASALGSFALAVERQGRHEHFLAYLPASRLQIAASKLGWCLGYLAVTDGAAGIAFLGDGTHAVSPGMVTALMVLAAFGLYAFGAAWCCSLVFTSSVTPIVSLAGGALIWAALRWMNLQAYFDWETLIRILPVAFVIVACAATTGGTILFCRQRVFS